MSRISFLVVGKLPPHVRDMSPVGLNRGVERGLYRSPHKSQLRVMETNRYHVVLYVLSASHITYNQTNRTRLFGWIRTGTSKIAHQSFVSLQCAAPQTRLTRRFPVARSLSKASGYWRFALGGKIMNSHFLCYNIVNNDL